MLSTCCRHLLVPVHSWCRHYLTHTLFNSRATLVRVAIDVTKVILASLQAFWHQVITVFFRFGEESLLLTYIHTCIYVCIYKYTCIYIILYIYFVPFFLCLYLSRVHCLRHLHDLLPRKPFCETLTAFPGQPPKSWLREASGKRPSP